MPNFMFWALAAANANPGPRTPTSPDAMATAPVVIAGTYVDAIQPVVVSGMPLAGATPEQQQMPVVVVAGTYVRAQSRELARGIGSVQRGIARQLSGGTSSTAAARAFDAEQADAAKVQCAQCKGAKEVDGATDVHDAPIESRARRACSLTFWASWRRCVASSTTRRRTSWPTARSHVDPLTTALLAA